MYYLIYTEWVTTSIDKDATHTYCYETTNVPQDIRIVQQYRNYLPYNTSTHAKSTTFTRNVYMKHVGNSQGSRWGRCTLLYKWEMLPTESLLVQSIDIYEYIFVYPLVADVISRLLFSTRENPVPLRLLAKFVCL